MPNVGTGTVAVKSGIVAPYTPYLAAGGSGPYLSETRWLPLLSVFPTREGAGVVPPR